MLFSVTVSSSWQKVQSEESEHIYQIGCILEESHCPLLVFASC